VLRVEQFDVVHVVFPKAKNLADRLAGRELVLRRVRGRIASLIDDFGPRSRSPKWR